MAACCATRTSFITPVPLIQQGTDNFSAYPGFDPLTSTYYSKAIQHVYLPTYPGGTGGQCGPSGTDAVQTCTSSGANGDFDFGDGWTVSDKFPVSWAATWTPNALFSGSNPATLNDELYNLSTGLGGYQLPAGSATADLRRRRSGSIPTKVVIHQGWWVHPQAAVSRSTMIGG